MQIAFSFILGLTAMISGWSFLNTYNESAVGADLRQFVSVQLASDPTNGECLTTNGTGNVWSTCSAGTNFWNDAGSYLYPKEGDYVSAPRFVATGTASSTFTNASSTNLNVANKLTFGGVTGTTWAAFCTSITGGSGLCDGVDATGVGGISTSTAVSAGNLAYWTSDRALSQVATGTLSETVTGLELSASRGLVGGAAALALTTGYSIPTTTLMSNLGTFYNTPSNRISDGTGLTWSTNTLNCDTASGSVQGCLTAADWTSFNGRVASSAINSLSELETLTGVTNILIENDIDASSELLALMDDETGTGRLVFSASPAFSGTATFSSLTATGTATFASAGITVGSSIPFSDAAGTLTLQNVDVVDATTEITIEAAIDTLSNLTSIGTIGTGVWQGTAIGTAYGGLGANTSGYTNGLIGYVSSAITDIDSDTEIDTALGVDVVTVTADDITSADLITILSNETGSNRAVFSGSPAFSGTATFASITGTSSVNFSSSSLRLPYATAPTLSTNGHVGIDSTSNQFKYQSGGSTFVLGNGNLYPSFTITATTTSFTGTTTYLLGPAYIAETWNGAQCFTDIGTARARFGDGTNWTNVASLSTTVGTVTLSSNNTFTAQEKRYVQIGTPASSPKIVSCTISKSLTAD